MYFQKWRKMSELQFQRYSWAWHGHLILQCLGKHHGLKTVEGTSNFATNFISNYAAASKVKRWAYCYHTNSGLNANMHTEGMHETIKYIYLKAGKLKCLIYVWHIYWNFYVIKLSSNLLCNKKESCKYKLCCNLQLLTQRRMLNQCGQPKSLNFCMFPEKKILIKNFEDFFFFSCAVNRRIQNNCAII